ncbi:hypothetical protein [Pengzhenrongella sicca]|uniref:DUF2510 domain-containing protein n=1 Tax=Pengzhenrongella sicca TaxID=2819238 RepID=A0A8A4ZEX6_9MICO|nr:hypothetical protein [Pengzhenrongella sicca]QTE30540.1 hypothetical protein J4E96_06070 [Pengzhenrongella sicca]
MSEAGGPLVATGWYPDPMRRAALRQWSGSGWTARVSDGHSTWDDPRPVRRALVAADLDALRFVENVFLPEALAQGADTPARQLALLAELTTEARRGAAPAPARPAPAAASPALPHQGNADTWVAHPGIPHPGLPHPAVPRPAAPPAGRPPRPAAPGPARPRSAAARWSARARRRAGSDLALHGLAYLGVLLLFIGVFGLVAFAFADVTPGLRPVAELACASVPFAAARLLRARGATVAAQALEIAGGLLLPVLLITSMVDGSGLPPDLAGGALVVALTLGCAALSVALAAWAHRHPASGVRFAVAPAVWFAVAAATLGAGRAVPQGRDVAVPTAWQVCAVSAALVLTLAAGRRWPSSALAAAALRAGVSGTVVLAVLAAVTGAAQGWPGPAVAGAGIALLVALVLLRPVVPAPMIDVVAPGWWALVGLALAPSLPAGALAALLAAGFLALLEHAHARGARAAALVLPGAGLAVCLAVAAPDPGWAAALYAGLAAWALARRTRPLGGRGGARVLDLAAAALPAASVLALATAADGWVALAAAAALVLTATVPARWPVLRRHAADQFWPRWWRGAVPTVAAGALVAWPPSTTSAQAWLVAGVLVALAGAAAVGPLAPPARTWAVVALAAGAWLVACDAGALGDPVRGIVLAAAALALVALAHLRARPAGAAIGLAGHATALLALALAGAGWPLVVVVALATAGCAVTAVAADGGRSPVGATLAGVGRPLTFVPWAAVAAGLPAVVVGGLDSAGLLAADDPWTAAVLAVVALGYALVTRAPVAPRCAATLAWAAFALALAAAGSAWAPWPAVVGLGAVIAAPALIAAPRRAAVMGWTAWVAMAPFAGLVAHLLVPPFAALPGATQVAATLTVVGGALLVGSAAADLRGSRWVPRPRPLHAWLVPPATVGALGLAGALALLAAGGALDAAGSGPLPGAGLITLGVAAILLAVGVLARAGALAGAAAVVGWFAALELAGPTLGARPLVAVVAAAALVATAQTLHGLTAERGWWSRWDAPVLIAAAPVALTALAAAADGDRFTSTFALVGLLVAGVAVQLRARAALAEVLGWTGATLVLVGAGAAGAGWLALTLAALATVHTGLAVRAADPGSRTVRQLTGVAAAVAAWVAALDWFAWSTQAGVDATAVGAGAVAVVAAALTRAGRTDRSWSATWGGAAAAVLLVAVGTSLRPAGLGADDVAPGGWVMLGLVGLTAALAGSARPFRAPWLRDACAGSALAALLVALDWLQAGDATRAATLAALVATLALGQLALGQLAVAQLAVREPAAGQLATGQLTPARRGRAAHWVRPAGVLGVAAVGVAALLGLAALPDAGPLVPVLAAAAVQVAAAGVRRRSIGLQLLAPALACVAWLLFVADVVGGGPQWYSVAIGLTLLAVAALWRRDRRGRGLPVAAAEVVAIELTGLAFVVSASLVQAVTQSVAHALVAAALGIAIAVWGVGSRVRRRVAAGTVVLLTSVVLLVAAPLVALLPAWGGAWVWILIAVAGLAAVLATTLIERGRAMVTTTRGRLGRATAGWE